MMFEPEIVKAVYIVAALLFVGLFSWINWKSNAPEEAFNAAKFLSAYIRTVWALIPFALFTAIGGLSVEGFLGVAGVAFGLDNVVLASADLGKSKAERKAEAVA